MRQIRVCGSILKGVHRQGMLQWDTQSGGWCGWSPLQADRSGLMLTSPDPHGGFSTALIPVGETTQQGTSHSRGSLNMLMTTSLHSDWGASKERSGPWVHQQEGANGIPCSKASLAAVTMGGWSLISSGQGEGHAASSLQALPWTLGEQNLASSRTSKVESH